MFTRRTVIAGSAALAAAPALSRPKAFQGRRPATTIDAAARKALQAGACPGVQVAVWHEGKSVLSTGFGLANIETASPVTPATVFRIGSLTKQFTAAAIIKLASQSRLRVQDPVSDYLSSMKRLPRLTLLELMNHTAGLHDDEQDVSCSAGAAGPKSQVQLADEIAAQHKAMDFNPGTAWLYSNANYIVLGAVVEKVTGKPFARALSEMIFQPFKLASTAVDDHSDVVMKRASGYTPDDDRPTRFANAEFIQISDAGGAGAMRSNATDLCAWHDALLSGRLFGREYVQLMLTPGRLRDGRLSGDNRFSPQDANYGDVQYACGLLVQDKGAAGRVITHNGFINGFSTVLETYPERRMSFAVLCNADVGPALPFRDIRLAVAASA